MSTKSGAQIVLAARSTSSCAACKFLKRRCAPTCLFAPHFRSDEPRKFAKVHKIFGASNISKILAGLPQHQRDEAVTTLVYEAEARLRDPVYGCVGAIAVLQAKMSQLQHDLAIARTRLACVMLEDQRVESGVSTVEFDDGGFYWTIDPSESVDESGLVPFP